MSLSFSLSLLCSLLCISVFGQFIPYNPDTAIVWDDKKISSKCDVRWAFEVWPSHHYEPFGDLRKAGEDQAGEEGRLKYIKDVQVLGLLWNQKGLNISEKLEKVFQYKPELYWCEMVHNEKADGQRLYCKLPVLASGPFHFDPEDKSFWISLKSMSYGRGTLNDEKTPIWPALLNAIAEAHQHDSPIIVDVDKSDTSFDCSPEHLAPMCRFGSFIARVSGMPVKAKFVSKETSLEDTVNGAREAALIWDIGKKDVRVPTIKDGKVKYWNSVPDMQENKRDAKDESWLDSKDLVFLYIG